MPPAGLPKPAYNALEGDEPSLIPGVAAPSAVQQPAGPAGPPKKWPHTFNYNVPPQGRTGGGLLSSILRCLAEQHVWRIALCVSFLRWDLLTSSGMTWDTLQLCLLREDNICALPLSVHSSANMMWQSFKDVISQVLTACAPCRRWRGGACVA